MNIKLTQFIVESSGSYITILNYISNGNISNSVSTLNSWSAAEQLLDEYTSSLAAGLAGAGATNVNVGTLENYTTYKKKNITFDLQVSDTIDYSTILTSINTNLTNLNINITNKDTQSDIVSILKTIFCYVRPNGKSYSCIKSNRLNQSSASDDEISFSTIYYKLHSLLQLIYNVNLPSNSAVSYSNSIINDISKKLSLTIPDNEDNVWNCGISRRLAYLCQIISGKSITNASSMRSDSLLKEISNKLANSNDLHTISQAIDLISTAIAQTPTTDTTGLQTELGKISTAVNNIENNPLFELNANVNGIEVCKKNNKNELDF